MIERVTPPFPKPMKSRGRLLDSLLAPLKFWRSRRCSLSALHDRSYRMRLGEAGPPWSRFYFAADPDLVRKVLVDKDRQYEKSAVAADMFGLIAGDGLIISNGETWARQRRIMDPVFALTRNTLVFDLMMAAVDAMSTRLAAAADKGETRIDAEISHVTADIMYRTIFGAPLDDATAERVPHLLHQFQEAAFAYGVTRMTGLPGWCAPGAMREARRSASAVRRLIDPLVEARHRSFEAGVAMPQDDILSGLIQARDPVTGGRFALRELCEQVSMLFLAGHESTASTLSWALYLLAADQAEQQRAATEVAAVLGTRRPQYGDLRQLPCLRNVFAEALRLYPPFPFVTRATTCPVSLRKKTLAIGAVVNVSLWVLHRHQRYWTRPNSFEPDRFERPEEREAVRGCYMPFGRGERVCIGAAFAQQEAILILAEALRSFQFQIIPGAEPVAIGRLTVRARDGIRLRIRRREQPSLPWV